MLFGEAPFEFRIEERPSDRTMRSLLADGPLLRWLREQGLLDAAP